jgi:septal ring factor EnvC (AmiA/AmiB activator)
MEQETADTLKTHNQELTTLREKVKRLSTQQQESARLLQGLSAAYKNLEPLLTRLSGIVSGE